LPTGIKEIQEGDLSTIEDHDNLLIFLDETLLPPYAYESVAKRVISSKISLDNNLIRLKLLKIADDKLDNVFIDETGLEIARATARDYPNSRVSKDKIIFFTPLGITTFTKEAITLFTNIDLLSNSKTLLYSPDD
jgi:hypothetical protein